MRHAGFFGCRSVNRGEFALSLCGVSKQQMISKVFTSSHYVHLIVDGRAGQIYNDCEYHKF